MRIAATLWAASLAACGPSEPELPAGPSCARSYAAIVASFAELHRSAGKPMPPMPDRATWTATCEGLGLAGPVLTCLEPLEAADRSAACAEALADVDRSALDQPFLDAMLTTPGVPSE